VHVIIGCVAALIVLPTATAGPSITLACGLAVFAAAMTYDLSDRERVTRRSDCAFWLHLLAAPLIVHPLIAFSTRSLGAMSPTEAGTILGIVGVLAIVAIIVDRRALVVSTLLYLGIVIAYALTNQSISNLGRSYDRGYAVFATLLILGTLVVALGVAWLPLRKLLLSAMSVSVRAKLPPLPETA
jgi:hypothetical protein